MLRPSDKQSLFEMAFWLEHILFDSLISWNNYLKHKIYSLPISINCLRVHCVLDFFFFWWIKVHSWHAKPLSIHYYQRKKRQKNDEIDGEVSWGNKAFAVGVFSIAIKPFQLHAFIVNIASNQFFQVSQHKLTVDKMNYNNANETCS